MPKIYEKFRCVGMLFTERTTQDDVLGALDFKNREFLGEDLERELGMGIMPEGMLLKAVGGDRLARVVTVGWRNQEVRVV